MIVLVGKVNLEGDGKVTTIFSDAAELRCAWITGTDELSEQRVDDAVDAGYTIFPSRDSDCWVAVRNDLLHDNSWGDNQLNFGNAKMGDIDIVMLGEDDDVVTDRKLTATAITVRDHLEVVTYRIE